MPAGAVCPCGALTTRPSKRCERCELELAEWQEVRRQVYRDPRWRRCQQLVWYRDGYACVDCGKVDLENRGRSLQADHDPGLKELLARSLDPFDPQYARTRCLVCHGRRGGKRLLS